MTDEEWFDAITTNHHYRRELLWLRSKARGDDALAAAVLKDDPHIVTRLGRVGLNLEQDRAGFAILYDIREEEIEWEIASAQSTARRATLS